MSLAPKQLAARRRVRLEREKHAGAANQLRDDDALGAVDNEGAASVIMGGKSPMNSSCSSTSPVSMIELHVDVQRLGEGQVAGAALEFGVLGLAELVRLKCSSIRLPVKSWMGLISSNSSRNP